MTTKRQDDGLFPSTSLVPAEHQSAGSLVPIERGGALAKAERRVTGEAHKRQLIITEERRISEHGQRAIAALHVNDNRVFAETADSIWATRLANGRDAELQRFIDHYTAQNIQSAGTYIHAATVAGSQQILGLIDRSLYMPSDEPRGFWARLLGDDE